MAVRVAAVGNSSFSPGLGSRAALGLGVARERERGLGPWLESGLELELEPTSRGIIRTLLIDEESDVPSQHSLLAACCPLTIARHASDFVFVYVCVCVCVRV